ncbi:Uncharacterised protein [Mycobacteroides abscessus subsp. massiliense]|nr:Uncharacterised protein [Mycobacteroides abscessus subsp. massiliense]
MRRCPSDSDFECNAVAVATCSGVNSATSESATAQAASEVSRVIVCSRMPNRRVRPRSFARARTVSIFAAAAAGNAAGEEPPKYSCGKGVGGSETRASVTV